MLYGRADCTIQGRPSRGTTLATWHDSWSEVSGGSGLVRVTTVTRDIPPPFVTLYTAEEAGRLGLALLAAAREGGWQP